MKIAILADPLDSFKIYKDTTFALMREAARRGIELFAMEPHDLSCEGGRVRARTRRIRVREQEASWYEVMSEQQSELTTFDAVLVRKDPPFDMEYLYATHLLELAERHGARIVNRPAAIRNHNEKLAILEFPALTAPTLVSRNVEELRAFHHEHHDVIYKPLDGMGGRGIFRVKADGLNLGAILETLTEDGQQTIMAQKYIPDIVSGDKRILLIGGEVVPYCLARVPQNGEVRGNLAAGGKGEARELSDSDWMIAKALAPQLYARGLFLVGLDVIGKHLTEINVTSPTCFQEISAQTGFDVAAMYLDRLVDLISDGMGVGTTRN